jgi:hypothetical protein
MAVLFAMLNDVVVQYVWHSVPFGHNAGVRLRRCRCWKIVGGPDCSLSSWVMRVFFAESVGHRNTAGFHNVTLKTHGYAPADASKLTLLLA